MSRTRQALNPLRVPRGSSLADRLRSRSIPNDSNGCLEWEGCRNQDGYGRINVDGRLESSHRMAYETFVGAIPDGMHVLHKCDNPPCINPAHLFLGTQAENVADMISKGRKAILTGEEHGSAKLKWSDVLEIRAAREVSSKTLASKFGVARDCIQRIRANRNWKG